MSKIVQLILVAAALAAVMGCGAKDLVGLGDDRLVYSGPVYPATSEIATAFQPGQVSPSCRVFAEVLVQLPVNLTGQDIQKALLAEAGKRGADQILVGQTRRSEKDEGLRFLYYGPKNEYLCADQCGGWKFGYDLWQKQGEWVTVGYSEWGNADARFEFPLVTQLAMLRCR